MQILEVRGGIFESLPEENQKKISGRSLSVARSDELMVGTIVDRNAQVLSNSRVRASFEVIFLVNFEPVEFPQQGGVRLT